MSVNYLDLKICTKESGNFLEILFILVQVFSNSILADLLKRCLLSPEPSSQCVFATNIIIQTTHRGFVYYGSSCCFCNLDQLGILLRCDIRHTLGLVAAKEPCDVLSTLGSNQTINCYLEIQGIQFIHTILIFPFVTRNCFVK